MSAVDQHNAADAEFWRQAQQATQPGAWQQAQQARAQGAQQAAYAQAAGNRPATQQGASYAYQQGADPQTQRSYVPQQAWQMPQQQNGQHGYQAQQFAGQAGQQPPAQQQPPAWAGEAASAGYSAMGAGQAAGASPYAYAAAQPQAAAQQRPAAAQQPQAAAQQRRVTAADFASDSPLDREGVRAELSKERQRNLFFRILRSTLFSLVAVAAVAVIVVTLLLPILQISGNSMTETLHDQDIVVAMRGSNCKTGDVIAFYYNNKILVKRVIAKSGQWVDIDDSGNVYVDGVLLDEPYVNEKALGECNIDLPYQVPEGRLFVMGDHRSISVDSRSTTVGCVANEQIVGKLLVCAWPLERFGAVN